MTSSDDLTRPQNVTWKWGSNQDGGLPHYSEDSKRGDTLWRQTHRHKHLSDDGTPVYIGMCLPCNRPYLAEDIGVAKDKVIMRVKARVRPPAPRLRQSLQK